MHHKAAIMEETSTTTSLLRTGKGVMAIRAGARASHRAWAYHHASQHRVAAPRVERSMAERLLASRQCPHTILAANQRNAAAQDASTWASQRSRQTKHASEYAKAVEQAKLHPYQVRSYWTTAKVSNEQSRGEDRCVRESARLPVAISAG